MVEAKCIDMWLEAGVLGAFVVGRISELILYPRILLCSPLLFGRQHLRDQRGNAMENMSLKVAEFEDFFFVCQKAHCRNSGRASWPAGCLDDDLRCCFETFTKSVPVSVKHRVWFVAASSETKIFMKRGPLRKSCWTAFVICCCKCEQVIAKCKRMSE